MVAGPSSVNIPLAMPVGESGAVRDRGLHTIPRPIDSAPRWNAIAAFADGLRAMVGKADQYSRSFRESDF